MVLSKRLRGAVETENTGFVSVQNVIFTQINPRFMVQEQC